MMLASIGRGDLVLVTFSCHGAPRHPRADEIGDDATVAC
jgi:hypothetical protein